MGDPVSYWMERLDRPSRPVLEGTIDADVCIIGGGYSGLWTAYYLARVDPSLKVVIVESEHVGFGASGRNGGWVSAKLAGLDRMLRDPNRRDAGRAMQRAMYETLDEIAAVVTSESIECGFHMGGTVTAATRRAHVDRLQRWVEMRHEAGFGEDHIRWLNADEARSRIRTSRLFGAAFTPQCAVVDPARLALGLAAAAERRGVVIYEGTPGTVSDRGVETPRGGVRTGRIVVATEAYRTVARRERRRVIPVYSLMVMTAPLPPGAWDEIGLFDRESFSDGRNMIIYGQRTDDGRIAFGGRGAPYHYGSAIADGFDRNERTFAFLRETLSELFPVLRGIRYDGAWGGPLAIPRDWQPSISFDGRVAIPGGYVGQGVAAANLAGRTVADLVRGERTARTELPWVGHHSRKWEPEPLRWVGVNLGRKLTESIDHAEDKGRRPRVRQAMLDRLPVG